MWTCKYKSRPQRRVPLIHEQIVMQCAKKIVRVASALPLPQPRCPSGHVPVVVELRRAGEAAAYRYHVNVPASGWPIDDSTGGADGAPVSQSQLLVHPGTLTAERPPCPMHGRRMVDPTSAFECWSPSSSGSGSNSSNGPTPPMVITLSSLHVVNGQSNPPNPSDIITISEPTVAGEAPEHIRAHFMATLYQQDRSPLDYSHLWLHNRQTKPPPPAPRPLSFRESRPIIGPIIRRAARPLLNERHKIAELCLDINGEYVKNEQLQKPFNGYPLGGLEEQQLQQMVPPLNGLTELKDDLYGYGDLSFEHAGPKNGYKSSDQLAAYSDQDKVLRLHSQDNQIHESWPRPEGAAGPLLDQVLCESCPSGNRTVEPLEKQPPRNVTDVAVPSEAPELHYPMELQTLFRWNYCSLCHTAMRTVRNAVDHYSSRAHDRRVSSWLVRQGAVQATGGGFVYADVAGAWTAGEAVEFGAGGGAAEEVLRHLRTARPSFYCDLCDLKLTSVMHAQQHFFGRRHRMVARNLTKPNGEGYYDEDGRWVRTNAKWLMCDLCDVSITSESQMAMHMAGARHRRRAYTAYAGGGGMALGGADLGCVFGGGVATFDGGHMYRVNANGSLAPLNPLGLPFVTTPNNDGLYPSQEVPPRPLNDQNAAYYCVACNVSLNHMKSVKQHEEGRMHRRSVQRLPGLPVAFN